MRVATTTLSSHAGSVATAKAAVVVVVVGSSPASAELPHDASTTAAKSPTKMHPLIPNSVDGIQRSGGPGAAPFVSALGSSHCGPTRRSEKSLDALAIGSFPAVMRIDDFTYLTHMVR